MYCNYIFVRIASNEDGKKKIFISDFTHIIISHDVNRCNIDKITNFE